MRTHGRSIRNPNGFAVGALSLQLLPKFGNFKQIQVMSKNTSVSLGNYFDDFVSKQVAEGRYKNVSEVIRAGLRLLENEESKALALKYAIQEGIDSGIAHDFDPETHLKELKAKSKTDGKV